MAFDVKDNRRSPESPRELGERGEAIAVEHLVASGYRLVMSNFKVPLGRNARKALISGEIDIIALDGDVLCFVEVKTRSSDEFAEPSAAVNLRKQRQIIRAARLYRRIFGIREIVFRYDVVSIVMKPTGPLIELTKGFWSESKFRKQRWSAETWQYP